MLYSAPVNVPDAMALQLVPPNGDGGPEMPQKPCARKCKVSDSCHTCIFAEEQLHREN